MYSFVRLELAWRALNKVLLLSWNFISFFYKRLTVVCHLTVLQIGLASGPLLQFGSYSRLVLVTDIAEVE